MKSNPTLNDYESAIRVLEYLLEQQMLVGHVLTEVRERAKQVAEHKISELRYKADRLAHRHGL